ncbi:hypothetical protein KI387_022647 [Taxus chinensis]|uniref:Pentatricopeptide repeat-containing protein n=1 Tax=Taxus chinensis TaxID=29808 RepID=A0AA38G1F3_TAXCH|nr:hypothetical protein KI387_022647 [Taxus chinensis]
MQTPTLFHFTLNRGKDSILRCPSIKMLEMCTLLIQEKMYSTSRNNPFQNLQKGQLYTSPDDLPNSLQSSVCRNHGYALCAFPSFDDRMLVPHLRIFSSDSNMNAKQCPGIRAFTSVGSSFKDDAKDCCVADNVRRICKLVKLGEETMEEKLTEMNFRPSPQLVVDVLRNTSGHADSTLRFFAWAKSQPQYNHSSVVYNEIVNIAGANGDFEAVGSLVEEMTAKGHYLTERSFSFMLSSPSIRSVTEGLVDTFSKLEYSVRMAAFHSLVSFLHRQSFFGIANWVLKQMVARGKTLNVSYYNALLAARCRRGRYLEAKRLLDEMKKFGCQPNTNSYNYLLGALCKAGKIADVCQLLDMMEKSGHRPDPITYEILIFLACKTNEMNGALEFLNKMITDGLTPRFSTYAAFIKGYFHTKQFEEAYNFVDETSKKDPSADSMNYMLLANLFENSGMILEAQSVLLKMIEKGLIPKFSLCRKVTQNLFQNGKQDMAQGLEYKFNEIRNTINKSIS